MWFRNIFTSQTSISGRRLLSGRQARRLCLEAMEDRCMFSFIGPVTYPADSIPPEPPGPVQDFNGDGYYDFATPGENVYLGNSDGTFRTGQPLPLSGYMRQPGQGVGDFNGDGKLDLVGTSTTYNDESNSTDYMDVWLGRGDGTFPVRTTYELGGEQNGGLRVVDLEGNGRDDVLLLGIYGSLDVWVGRADGALEFSQHFGGGSPIRSVTACDLNLDGRTDLVASASSLSVFLGNGNGTLRSAGAYASGGISPEGAAVADFDRDGRPDIAVLNGGDWYSEPVVGRSLAVLLGNGDGSFQSPHILVAGPDAGLRAVADVNADDFPDVVVGYSGSDASVMVNATDWPVRLPSIAINDVTVTEGNTGQRAATFTVTLSAASSQGVTVNYAAANGSATTASDYQVASGTLTVPAGQTTGMITVLVSGDRLGEPNEAFVVNLSSPSNATIADDQGVGTIVDDEPRISMSDVSKKEGKKNQTTLWTFTVTLSVAYDQPVTMSFSTVSGTATTSDNDYIAKTGTLTFAPGETTKTITIEVKGDNKREANEYFYLDLFGNSSNSSFTKNRGIGTILNDD